MKTKTSLAAMAFVAACLGLAAPAYGQSCTPFPPYPLTNGTTANGSDVVADMDCLAPLSNPSFTGNVGIGTIVPTSTNLQVFGSGVGIQVGNTSSGTGSGDGGKIELSNYFSYMTLELNNGINADPTDGSLGMYGTFGGGSSFPWSLYGALVFYTRNDPTQGWIDFRTGNGGSSLMDRMVISPGGLVGIGTTSPAGPLNVYSPSAATSIYIGSTVPGHTFSVLGTSADTNGYFFIQPVSVAGSTYGNTILNPTAGDVGIGTVSPSYALQVNGQVAGNGAYVNTSDVRLKKNIRPIENALAAVERMQGVRFNWRTPTERAVGKDLKLPISEPQVGFIAQDLEKVLPEAVTTANDPERLKSVAESKVVPVLVEAVKELKAENDRLETLVNRQASTNEELRRNDRAMRAELGRQSAADEQRNHRDAALRAELTGLERHFAVLQAQITTDADYRTKRGRDGHRAHSISHAVSSPHVRLSSNGN